MVESFKSADGVGAGWDAIRGQLDSKHNGYSNR